jgi:hypothetical protein
MNLVRSDDFGYDDEEDVVLGDFTVNSVQIDSHRKINDL